MLAEGDTTSWPDGERNVPHPVSSVNSETLGGFLS